MGREYRRKRILALRNESNLQESGKSAKNNKQRNTEKRVIDLDIKKISSVAGVH